MSGFLSIDVAIGLFVVIIRFIFGLTLVFVQFRPAIISGLAL